MKKLYQSSWYRINAVAQEELRQKNKAKQVFVVICLMLFVIGIPMMPFVLTEQFVSSCELCQDFMTTMSSVIPGIDMISKESSFQGVVALQIAVSWVIIIIVTFFALNDSEVQNGFSELLKPKYFLFLFIWILNEFGFGFGISYFCGSGFGLHDTKTGLLHFLIQYKISVGALINIMIFYEVVLLVYFASFCKIILNNLFRWER